jgi:hypothetical protein
MLVLHSWQKSSEGFENATQVLQSGNVAKCSLTIMDANITWLAKNTNEKFRRSMWVLWGENIIKCNMKYSYACIAFQINVMLIIIVSYYLFN